MAEPLQRVPATRVHSGTPTELTRVLPDETPVALVYDGSTHAVMMATPQDLQDFAVGFSLSEGKISDASEIAALDVVEQDAGIELRMWMSPGAGHRLAVRRRAMLGPTGCGLCGIESLTEALPPLGKVTSDLKVSAVEIEAAVASLAPAQKLNSEARALHAAGFWTLDRGLVALREDVGRHNALDKLAGALSRAAADASGGIVVLTSRISVELVQKAVRMGAPVLVAVSAPTALAVRVAEASGVTVVGIARDDTFEIFTHPERITSEPVRRHRPVRHSSEEPVHAIC
jgi:FdhD protein